MLTGNLVASVNKISLFLLFSLLCSVAKAQSNDARIAELDKQAYGLYEQGRFEEALEKYIAIIALDPESIGTYYNAAVMYQRLNRPDESIANAEKALQYKDNYPEARRLLADMLYQKGDKEKAVIQYGQVWEERESKDNPVFADALKLFTEKNYDEALYWLEKCRDHNIALFYSNYYLGLIYHEKTLYDKACYYSECATAYKNEKDLPKAYMVLGISKAKNKEYFDAIAALSTFIETGTPTAQSYFYRGWCRVKSREYGFQWNACDDFKKAQQFNPTALESHYGIALAHLETKRFLAGKKLLDSLIIAVPGSWELYNALGRVYVGLKQYDQALNAFNTAKRIYASYPDIYLETGKLYLDINQPEKALTELETALRMDSADNEIKLYHARAISLNGRAEEAKKTLNELLKLKYNEFSRYNCGMTYYFLGLIHLEQNDEVDATSYFEEASKLVEEAGLFYGNWLYEKGEIDNARRAYTYGSYASIFGNPELEFLVASIDLSHKKYEEAERNFNKAVRLDPQYAEAWQGLGLTHIRMRKRDMAMEELTKAIELDRNLSEAHFQRALLHQKNKHPDEARLDLEAAASLGHQEALKRLSKE